MKKQTRIAALLICLAMLFTLLASCSNNGASASPSATPPKTSATPSGEPEQPDEPALGYPIGDYELDYWFPMFAEIMALFSDWNETPVRQEAEKQTGVKINWITPNSTNSTELFQVMVAGGDYPDMICYNNYIGGGDGAIKDEVYMRLNDLVDQYAPNYKALLDSNQAYYKDTRTDNGNMWAMHLLYAMDKTASGGLAWRQDIAETIGWSNAPTNITEFDTFLNDALDAGYSGFFSPPQYGFITGYGGGLLPASFGASTIFLNVDGAVQYGPMMSGFKDYIIQMKEWHDKGIIDPDFMSKAFYQTWSDIATGKYLVGVGVNGIIGDVYANNGVSNDPNCYIAAIRPLDQADGTPVKSGNYASFVSSATAVSTDCKIPEIAVRWLDYWYSDDGILLANYGIEDYSFEYNSDGKPQYLDLINNNPDNVPTATAMQALLFTSGPGYKHTIYESEHVEKAGKVWAGFSPVWNMPAGISLTSEESAENSAIMADVETFCAEAVAKMITGVVSTDEYDTYFINQLASMSIDKAIANQQAALDRYNSR